MLPTVMLAQTFSEVRSAWQAQHFGNLRCGFRGRRSILCPCKIKYNFCGRRSIFALSNGKREREKEREMHILRGRRSTLAAGGGNRVAGAAFCAHARLSTNFVAGAARSQG